MRVVRTVARIRFQKPDWVGACGPTLPFPEIRIELSGVASGFGFQLVWILSGDQSADLGLAEVSGQLSPHSF
jgi:hypothetical protein